MQVRDGLLNLRNIRVLKEGMSSLCICQWTNVVDGVNEGLRSWERLVTLY